jgi:hypothetical protein
MIHRRSSSSDLIVRVKDFAARVIGVATVDLNRAEGEPLGLQ